MSTRIILEKNVEMPLRDGTVTRANVYRPEADASVPAILVRTPYSKDLLFAQTFSLDPGKVFHDAARPSDLVLPVILS